MHGVTDTRTSDAPPRLAAWLLVVGLGLVLGGERAAAQVPTGPDNPAADTVSKRPFVLLLMDSSASMQWTQEGPAQYPRRAYGPFDKPDPYPSQPTRYQPGDPLGVDDSGDEAADFNGSSNPLMFGSCFVWEPACSSYERPSWKIDNDWTTQYGSTYEMGQRLRSDRLMRGDSSMWSSPDGMSDTRGFPVRLMNHNQPRHVTFKEILTGEMVFAPADKTGQTISSLNFRRYGPGCWFVPRQRGAAQLNEPVCCRNTKTITQPDGSTDVVCQDGFSNFERLPDHTDPRPHMQEVFDDQIDNGLIDNLGDQMHFAVTSFDSYKFRMDGATHPSSDPNAFDAEDTVLWKPHETDPLELSDPYDSGRSVESNTEGDYNLGIYRIIGPDEFPSTKNDMQKINRMTQKALVDTGTLKNRAYTDASQTSENSTFVEDPGVGSNAGSVLLSRQPISRNTPLAPALHDIHDYYRDPEGPITDDRFKSCRPKHTVVMTDGMPLPEAPASSPQCVPVGEESLQEPFAIDSDEYDYQCTEKTITDFVTDPNITVDEARYDPRVHVVGINQRNWTESLEKPTPVKKLASMAVSGKTCAGWYLGNRTDSEEDACGEVSTGPGDGPWIPDFDGDPTNGYCSKPEHPCLVRQFPYNDESGNKISAPTSFVSFSAPDECPPSGWDGCEYPSIILTCNSISENEEYFNQNPSEVPAGSTTPEAARSAFRECRDGKWSAKALQQIFNSILQSSGLASRTRASVTNELDDPNQTRSGQNRFYSGVRVQTGQPVWRGVLFREQRLCKAGTTPGTETITPSDKENPCATGNDVYDCFHREIGDQVVRDPNTERATEDNRRIFTSVPETRVFDYEKGEGKSATSSACGPFHSTYVPETDDGRGEFQQTYLDVPNGNEDDQLLHQRIPFATQTLKEALVGTSGDDDGKPIGDPDPDSDTDDSDDASLESYFNTTSRSELEDLLQSVRAQTSQREGSELGGILNSSPAAVPPPKLDVPVRSYREFKERFQNRPTMLYFATLDGMLHATHSGVLTDQIKQRDGMSTDKDTVFSGDPFGSLSTHESIGDAEQQREAWAYIPQMLHDDFAQFQGVNPNLLDGPPAVKNVRLCDRKLSNNQNFQACRIFCDGSRDLGSMCSSANPQPDCVPRPFQWRTVLVQGLGQAGSGYFALDVTRPGGPHTDTSGNLDIKRPDPIPLWEFNPSWEKGQLDYMIDNAAQFVSTGKDLVFPPSGERSDENPSSCGDEEFWKQPFLGQSVSQPAIGTVILPPLSDNSDALRRPVAVFGGGDFGSFGTSKCDRQARVGKAAYVVDMQTGSVLRRFVGYRDPSDNGEWKKFDAPIVGSPALYKSRPGRLASRGFIGDAKGRLYRIDFSGSAEATLEDRWDPANWEVTLFFDPAEGGNNGECAVPTGMEPSAAHLTPAVAENQAGNPVVVFGLGDPGDTPSKTDAHTILAVEETIGTRKDDDLGECLWDVNQQQSGGLRENEKVTGDPVIFNNAAFFTTYYLDDGNVCKRGNSRIWGVEFGVSGGPSLPDGVFDCNNPKLSQLDVCQPRFFEPDETAVVRGLTITLGPACNATPGTDTTARLQEGNDQQPQLIVQTGGAEPGTSSTSGGGGGGTGGGASGSGSSDFVHRMSVGLDDEFRRTVPLTWSVVN